MDSVIHFEIPFDQMERAQEFYQAVFDWQIHKIPEMEYYWAVTSESDPKTWMPSKPGAINGALHPRPHPGAKPTIVVNVESMDAALKKVEESGGRVLKPKTQIGEHGFYALISDTEGNTVGLWQFSTKK